MSCRALLTIATLLLGLLAGSTNAAQEAMENQDLGLRIPKLEDWKVTQDKWTTSSLKATAVPLDGRQFKLTLSADLSKPGSAVASRDKALKEIEAAGYEGATRFDRELAGVPAAGFDLLVKSAGKTYHLQRFYFERQSVLFVFEALTEQHEWEQHQDAIEAFWAGLEFSDISTAVHERQELQRLGRLCGSELSWAANWKDAAQRARREKRLVMVYVNSVTGFDTGDQQRMTTFMDPEVIGVIEERYVPFELGKDHDVPFADPKVYGLSPTTFGVACLLVSPDGEVLAERMRPDYDFLRRGPAKGKPMPKGLGAMERAQFHARRGEHEAAREALAGDSSFEALRLQADLFRREERGEEALAFLQSARETERGRELAADLDLDRCHVEAGLGRLDVALGLAREFMEQHSTDERLPEALLLRGWLERATGDKAAAEEHWDRLVKEHAESRWSWQAAAVLSSPYWNHDLPFDPSWPDPKYKGKFEPAPFEALPASKSKSARDDALAWLIANQQEDGSWLVPTQVSADETKPPDHFLVANAAFAVQALVGTERTADVQAALEKALAFLLQSGAECRAKSPGVYFMDYAVWSRSCTLQALADAFEAGVLERVDFEREAAWLVSELVERQTTQGGWSYYISGDLSSGETQPPLPFSFVTAQVVMALERAAKNDVAIPAGVLTRGYDSMQAMQHGVQFEYTPGSQAKPADLPGAAGRAPLCVLALHQVGRATDEDLAESLVAFLEHRESLTHELGKALMHCGPQAQGSHYVLFDHHWAAQALMRLSPKLQRKHRDALLESLLKARTSEGYFYDIPMTGSAWGTAVAVRAIDQLGRR